VIREKKSKQETLVRYPIAPSIDFDGMLCWTLGEIITLGEMQFTITYN
jgi:hypothetical protein